ncbi:MULTISPECIES: polysaccharide biosynthesis protein [Bacillaceae]|uniref:putative polysaccharide biosynthesis protein n=1 Tax=Bacillaceae TaxID=186817 RepID=UPI001E31B2BC|nr:MULTISPECIES: polysaccharide biosynthesis protein [Bacillaceae]MCE4051282.1 polysaccharide biosynthesis protein [Bacillus sp. Au-Bac7]MCM3032187.1 polysaccharide biosynthesis protein [Niallia sp. MER 6]MDL0436738.1 polysaccharide biosynthesis protein [Niallia sp. SS-2023]UPO86906.1 polysaccharide biosynthesis protein [Niallia sp. Man26]
MSSKLLRGTFILTLGTMISKALGLFYVIPFNMIVGKEGTILYQYSYVAYTIVISIATAGIPLAVSKFISKYNAMGEYGVSRRLFKSGLVVMTCTGFVCFLAMYFLAPFLAEINIPEDDLNSSVKDVTTVIRAVSFAVIVVPVMSLIRGFFQGHESMGPSAVSQVVEQIVRIVFMLGGAAAVLYVLKGDIVTAVSISTFAAFVGAIGGLAVLIYYWLKRKHHFNSMLLEDRQQISDISLGSMYKEILISAAPFVFVGIANPLFQFIDTITFNRAMAVAGLSAISETQLNAFNYQTHKIVIIPVSLATAFSMTLVPMITRAFVSGDQKSVNHNLNQAFQILLFITLPATIGLSVLAEPVYRLFYGTVDLALGTEVLRLYAPVAILFSLYAVTAAILQGINEQRFTVLSLLVGLLVKLSLNMPLIERWEAKGAILATALGYTAAIVINIFVIKVFAKYPFRLVLRRSVLIVGFTFLMFVGTEIIYTLLRLFLEPKSLISSLLMVGIVALAGGLIYAYLAYRSKLVYMLLGERAESIKRKLRLPF